MPNVTIYTLPNCGHCQKAKKFFEENDIKFKELDVSGDMDLQREMIEKSGQTGAPVILVGDELVVGYDRKKLKKLLAM